MAGVVEAEVREVEGDVAMMEMVGEVVGEVVGEGGMDRGDKGHHYHLFMRRDKGMRMCTCSMLAEVGRRCMLRLREMRSIPPRRLF